MMHLKGLPTVRIHPSLIIFIAISFVTGTFALLSIVLAIVLFHELGHFMMAKMFNWRIKGITLWVFGGVMDTEESAGRPLYEELLVIIAGPFQHIIIYFLLIMTPFFHVLIPSFVEFVLFYNTILLIFNLLPIWPLDGGRLLFTCLCMLSPYKKAYYTVIIFSIITIFLGVIVQLFLLPFSLSALLIMLFLLKENRSDWEERYYVFIRFLLTRIRKGKGSQTKNVQPIRMPYYASLMDVFAQFKREKTHSIYIAGQRNTYKTIGEKECLRRYFYDRQYDKSIGEIADQVI